jgi:hypothetical protein
MCDRIISYRRSLTIVRLSHAAELLTSQWTGIDPLLLRAVALELRLRLVRR